MASVNGSSTLNNDDYPRFDYSGRPFDRNNNTNNLNEYAHLSPTRRLSTIDEELPPGFVPLGTERQDGLNFDRLDTWAPNVGLRPPSPSVYGSEREWDRISRTTYDVRGTPGRESPKRKRSRSNSVNSRQTIPYYPSSPAEHDPQRFYDSYYDPYSNALYPLHQVLRFPDELFDPVDPYAFRTFKNRRSKYHSFLHHVFDQIMRQLYSYMLLSIPSMYFTRVSRVFRDAGIRKLDLKTLKTPSANKDDRLTEHLRPFRFKWEMFVQSIIKEWKTLNVVSVLLLSALLTMLQIDDAASDPITRTAILLSLVCTLMSLSYGCIYIVRFGTMTNMHKAAGFAQDMKRRRTSIWWNVLVLLAMPAVWLAWSMVFFCASVMSYVWTAGSKNDNHVLLGTRAEFGPRAAVTAVFALGVLYFMLIVQTFRSYRVDSSSFKVDDTSAPTEATPAAPGQPIIIQQPDGPPIVVQPPPQPSFSGYATPYMTSPYMAPPNVIQPPLAMSPQIPSSLGAPYAVMPPQFSSTPMLQPGYSPGATVVSSPTPIVFPHQNSPYGIPYTTRLATPYGVPLAAPSSASSDSSERSRSPLFTPQKTPPTGISNYNMYHNPWSATQSPATAVNYQTDNGYGRRNSFTSTTPYSQSQDWHGFSQPAPPSHRSSHRSSRRSSHRSLSSNTPFSQDWHGLNPVTPPPQPINPYPLPQLFENVLRPASHMPWATNEPLPAIVDTSSIQSPVHIPHPRRRVTFDTDSTDSTYSRPTTPWTYTPARIEEVPVPPQVPHIPAMPEQNTFAEIYDNTRNWRERRQIRQDSRDDVVPTGEARAGPHRLQASPPSRPSIPIPMVQESPRPISAPAGPETTQDFNTYSHIPGQMGTQAFYPPARHAIHTTDHSPHYDQAGSPLVSPLLQPILPPSPNQISRPESPNRPFIPNPRRSYTSPVLVPHISETSGEYQPEILVEPPSRSSTVAYEGEQEAAHPDVRFAPLPPHHEPPQHDPPLLNDMLNMSREQRMTQLAMIDQQREIMRYLRGLNEWLDRDAHDRQNELRGVGARVDTLRDDMARLNVIRPPPPPSS